MMSEQEAAKYLGLSTRTLLNYRRSGQLKYLRVKGKTRPVIEYDPSELDRLKAELTTKALKKAKPPKLRRVTFGLSLHDFEELAGEAKKGLNKHRR